MASAVTTAYAHPMASQNIKPNAFETNAEREARIDREAAVIHAGQAELDTGHGIPLDALKSWLTHRQTDPNAPLPTPLRPGQRC